MLGAFLALLGLNHLGMNYWLALLLAPPWSAVLGVVIERLMLPRLTGLDHLYGLLLTFGLALIARGHCSSTSSVSRANPMTCPTRWKAASIWASCSCRCIAGGSSSPRSGFVCSPGT